MSVVIEKTIRCAAPPAAAFAYVDDYRTVPDWMFGFSALEPRGALDHGLGAVFDVAMHLGMTLRSRVEVTEWDQDRVIALESIKGFKNTSRWTFEPDGAGTTILARLTYTLPFGPAGSAMGRLIEPFVAHAVGQSSDALAGLLDRRG